jgi:hypothetical protein
MQRFWFVPIVSAVVLAAPARPQDGVAEPVRIGRFLVQHSGLYPPGGGLVRQADDLPLAWLRADAARVQELLASQPTPDDQPSLLVKLGERDRVAVEVHSAWFHRSPPRLCVTITFGTTDTLDPRPLVQLFALAPGAPRIELDRVVAAFEGRGEPFDVAGEVAELNRHHLTYWWTLPSADVEPFLLVRNEGRLKWPMIRVPLPR